MTPASERHCLGGRLTHALIEIAEGSRRDLVARVVSGSLAPLSWLYIAGLKLYLSLYSIGLKHGERLPTCVVSVGNIASGGTGKTGFTITLIRALRAKGLRVCVLSRGFRGRYRGSMAVVSTPDEVLLTPDEAGDEPYLMARALPGTPVLVGKDRRATGRFAIERFGPDVIVLDDGMQYYQLHRDAEIALVAALRPFGNGRVLPAGALREPVGHLRRATHIVVSGATECVPAQLREILGRAAGAVPILPGRYRPGSVRDIQSGERRSAEVLHGALVITVCGLGNPESFEQTVSEAGGVVVASYRLLDHRPPTEDQVQAIAQHARGIGARAIVTSAKDAVKWPSMSLPIPTWVLEADFEVDGIEQIVETVARIVRAKERLRAT